jgi:hypothetical protein
MREVTAEHGKELERVVGSVVRHGTVQAIEAETLLKIMSRSKPNGFLQ